jgi:hypothetical protein
MKPPAASDDNVTGLRLLPTWRGVYWFVLISFAVFVVLLTVLTRMYS